MPDRMRLNWSSVLTGVCLPRAITARMMSPARRSERWLPDTCSTFSPPSTFSSRFCCAFSSDSTSPSRLGAGPASGAALRRPLRGSMRSSFSSTTVTRTSRAAPLRHTCSTDVAPGLVAPTSRGRSPDFSTGLPSKRRMTSPGSMPAFSAGPRGSTELTSAPSVFCRPKESASSRVTSWMTTPMRPRCTLPVARSWDWTSIATSIGIANDRPM